MQNRTLASVLAMAALMGATQAQAQVGQVPFRSDGGISGSTLSGWNQSGQAEWIIKDGEITARPKNPAGGWLILDQKFANLAFYTQVKCAGRCRAGILMRAEKTPNGGMKGIYVALSEEDKGAYAVTLDPKGVELSRTKLKAGATTGGLPPLFGNTPPHIAQFFATGAKAPAAPVALADITNLSSDYRPSDWNSLSVFLYNDQLRAKVNSGDIFSDSPIPQSIAPFEDGRYGPIALYVGGEGTALFRDVQYKDLMQRTIPVEQTSPNYDMRQLDGFFQSWSTAVADFNNDGYPDVAAGSWLYFGPDFKTARELYTPTVYNPTSEYPQLSTVNLAYDFTGDGWADVIQFTGNAGYIAGILHVNPKGESRPWEQYKVIDLVANEETVLGDIDGDGQPEVIHGGPGYALGYTKPNPKNPTGKWITTVIADKGPWGDFAAHGIGIGDINGDKRMDFISPFGWWEQPAAKGAGKWRYHPVAFGRRGLSQGAAGGAQLGVWDVNGDGLNDVVTPLEGHGFGLAWHEQKRDKKGRISFVRHIFMDGFQDKNAGDVVFTQPHAAAFADMDGDGILDLITGKRSMSHLATWTDPDPYGEPVLYVYRTVRDKSAPGGARFEPELVHNFSGVGAHIQAVDLNKDGMPDIATSGPYGTFIFLNKHKK